MKSWRQTALVKTSIGDTPYCIVPFAIGVVVTCLMGCASAPCPNDQALLDQFKARQAQFEKLASTPDNQELMTMLGIGRMIKRTENPKLIWFPAWSHDFSGPGGCMKGYAYCEERPSSVVESIDANSTPTSPEVKEIYRPIKGNWYLFYHSDN